MLAFTTQPVGGTGGLALATQPVVEIHDTVGKVVSQAVTVTVALTGTGTGKLSGTTSVTTTAGRAVFTDLSIDKIATDYRLVATATGVTSATSGAFVVALGPAVASKSIVTVTPGLLMAGDSTTVSVQLVDAGGNLETSGTQAVQFGLIGGTSAGTFSPSTDRSNGTYTSVFLASGFGTPASVTVALNGTTAAQVLPTIGVVGFTSVSISDSHACGTLNTGDAYCWGQGMFGELGGGQGNASASLKPTKVSGGIAWKNVQAGTGMTCGLAVTSRVYCWGSSGNFGTGSSLPQPGPVPLPIDGSFTFQALAVGWDAGACAITVSSTTVCWGDNAYGQVGSGTASTNGALPLVISGINVFAGIGRDLLNGCGITATGDGYCWGSNITGGLGVPDSTLPNTCNGAKCSPTPKAVPSANGLVPTSLSIGQNHVCALQSSGAAYCWGNGGSNNGQANPAVPRPTLLRFSQIVTGSSLYCGIATDAQTYCWGENASGVAGVGMTGGSVSVPTAINTSAKMTFLDAGNAEMCAVAVNGRAYCWGGNSAGQLGDGTTTDRSSPTLVLSVR